jgi:arylsulfatase A-like enzyme
MDGDLCPANLPGRSLLPLLEGEGPSPSRSTCVFAQYDRLRCCRTPEWKLIRNWRPGEPDELYDLREDPSESENLISRIEEPALQAIHDSLQSDLMDWMRRIDDPLCG